MLQLGRRRLCRLPSSYVCISCLASSHTPSVIQRRSVARHYARPLSTTVPRWEAAAPGASIAVADGNAEATEPVKAEAVEPIKADATESSPAPSPKKRKKKKQPKESLEDDAQRQLKVLTGALSALKNVLNTQGVDVSHIPGLSSITSTPPEKTAETAELEPELESKPKLKSKPKPKPKSKSKSKSKPAPTPAPTPKPTSKLKVEAKPKLEKGQEKRSKPAATPGALVRKIKSESKSPSPTKASARALRMALAKQMKQSEDSEVESGKAKPANLGVPFSGMVKPFGAKTSSAKKSASSTKSAPAPRKLPDQINPQNLSLLPIETPQPDVPSLSYDLDRVLFNPGVYHLQEPRSRVYNFNPYLSEIMPVNEFDFNALKEYVTSSKDSTLISIAKEHEKKYTGSTSSMTSMLAHFHYLLSAWRDVNVSMLSRGFIPESMQYTRIMKAPAAIFLHWKDGTYAIDADKEFDSANILSMLGKSMEKLLTLSKDGYERYRHGNSDQITAEERNAEEAFHYTGFQDFMMRSQLDAHDSRVPGTGMFDLKTRAVISIRMDAKGYQKGLGYEIRQRFGQWESFEREYYDMIRSAFLKYSLQVRMGRMDGIFVAFHNTQRIFGFQYIPLSEMDLALHGTDNTLLGDQEFKASLKLLNEILNRATKKWPEQSLRLHFETRTSVGAPFMYIFAKPTTPDEIEAVQNAGRASVEAFEKKILGLIKRADEDDVADTAENEDMNNEELDQTAPSPTQDMDSFTAWQEARQMVEEAMGDDELGVGLVREAIGDALEQSGILRPRSLEESHEYVNALLGALTERVPSSQTDAAAIDPNEEAIIDEDELEEQVTTQTREELDQTSFSAPLSSKEDLENVDPEQKNAEDSALAQPTEDVCETESRSSRAASTENITEEPQTNEPRELEEDVEEDMEEEEEDDYEEASEIELESDIEAKESTEDGASSSLEPLKSLIMRMARRIHESPISDTSMESPMDDASKLKEFERILGRLISQSRIDKPESESSDTLSDQNRLSESVPLDGTSADSPKSSEVASTPDLQEEGTQPAVDKEPRSEQEAEDPELLGLTLTIKNKVNGAYVDRPTKLEKGHDWTVEYEIEEIKQPRAQKIYGQLKERRRKEFFDTGDKDTEWYKMFSGNLAKLTNKGRQFREKEMRMTEGQPMYMVGVDEPLQWGDVFHRQPRDFQALEEEPNDQQEEDQKSELKEVCDTVAEEHTDSGAEEIWTE
ncbi:mitochondrial protein Pet127-domain-containing protein [Xylaria telfairii]|nr:mitochondrial protein Pet127-domain-containing protein [Xylaria telfairii]